MAVTLSSLFSVETATAIYQKGLDVATALGVAVTDWEAGDPTRSLYHFLAEYLATREEIQSQYIESGFLDDAEGEWLTIKAKQDYNVDRTEGSPAAGTLTLTNSSDGLYYSLDAGDLSFKSSTSGKTYRSTTAVAIGPGETDDAVGWVADEDGTDSSAGTDEIDELISALPDLSVTASVAGLGVDEQSDASLREACRNSLSALSPNGPANAYEYVATTPALTGSTEVTRAVSDGDNTTGDVTLYIAGNDGDVTAGAVSAVEDAIAEWATPLCITPTVVNATEVLVSVSITVYMLSGSGASEAEVQAAVQSDVAAAFPAVPIGGYGGVFPVELIRGAAKTQYPNSMYNQVVATPAADVALTAGQVAVLSGTPAVTVVFT